MWTPDTVVLPNIEWKPTTACGARGTHPITLVVAHRWGDKYINEYEEAGTYQGNINWFENPANDASAHLVYPGSAVPNESCQMVPWRRSFAWTEAAYNPTAVEVECADAIWLGDDPQGLLQLARIFGYLLKLIDAPALWSTTHGFCRHGDLGAAGGGHLDCPVATTDIAIWKEFTKMVQYQVERGEYRTIGSWGRN